VTWEDDLINNPYSGGVGGGSGSSNGGGNTPSYGSLAGELTPAVLDEDVQWSTNVLINAPSGDIITDITEYLKCFNPSLPQKLLFT